MRLRAPSGDRAVVRVVAMDADGQVHFSVFPGPVAALRPAALYDQVACRRLV